MLKLILNKVLAFLQIKFLYSPTLKSSEWVESVLATIPGYGVGIKSRLVLDNQYWVCSRKIFRQIVDLDWTDRLPYLTNRFDCENFAFTFMSSVNLIFGMNNVGVVVDWSSGHAYNIVLFDDGTWSLFEPQTDVYSKIGDPLHKLESGMIIL